MKKIISIFLIGVLCFYSMSFFIFAEDSVSVYTDDEKRSIYLKYTDNEYMFDALFNNDEAVGYWSLINDTEENGAISWAIDAASKILDEYPDQQDYAEILTNLIMMQSGDIAEQVQNQSQYDDLKDGADYANDIVGIAKEFISGANLLENISPIIDAATDGADVIVESLEQAKYYETSLRDYSQSKYFLEAVSQYAENEELRSVADSLLDANDSLLEKRLEYLINTTDILVEYEAKFFQENMSVALLKESDIYKADEVVKWYVDCGEKLSDSIGSIFAVGKAAFKMTILAGDIGFGTSDTFNRYQEMKVVADIAGAIVEANHNVKIPSNYNSPEILDVIQTKCNYYKMLIVTHARGEYLIYQLLVNDAGILSDFRVFMDSFKNQEDTTESWYNRQIDTMLKYYDILDNMFVVEEKNMTTDSSDNKGNEKTDAIASEWLGKTLGEYAEFVEYDYIEDYLGDLGKCFGSSDMSEPVVISSECSFQLDDSFMAEAVIDLVVIGENTKSPWLTENIYIGMSVDDLIAELEAMNISYSRDDSEYYQMEWGSDYVFNANDGNMTYFFSIVNEQLNLAYIWEKDADETLDYNAMADIVLANEEMLGSENSMGVKNIPGIRTADFNFDGIPELIVESSGGSMGNCPCAVYSIQISGLENLGGYDTGNLQLYYDESTGEKVFIGTMHHMDGVAYYEDHVFELSYQDDRIYLCEIMYTVSDDRNYTGNPEFSYFINTNQEFWDSDNMYGQVSQNFKQVSEEEYNEFYDSYYSNLKNLNMSKDFISFSDWNMMDQATKKERLVELFENYRYDEP